jgi:hypothetical protein
VRSRALLLAALAACITAAVGLVASAYPTADRILLAIALTAGFLTVAGRSRRAAVILVAAFLPLLGLVRRLLIFDAGWSSADPLLLVAPAVAVFLLVRTIFINRAIPRDLLATLVLSLLLFTLFEVLNPSGAGIAANATGLLFTAAPLLWFFVGGELSDKVLIRWVLVIWVVEACLIALYGLVQTFNGLPPWDQRWVDVTGYQALFVGQQLRAIGTFASAAEYAVFLAIGTVICLSALRARLLPLLAVVGLLVTALLLESSRGIILLTLVALLVVAGLRTGRTALAIGTVVVGLGGAVALNAAFGSSIASSATSTNNALITHQVQGLTNPLNPDQSTLPLHLQIVWQGLLNGFAHPLGLGPGATNRASEQAGTTSQGTEVDVSNAFVGGGLVGGLLYLAIVAVSLRRVWGLALRRREFTFLCIAGVLVVALGQWLNGGYYAVAPFIWLAIGFANQQWLALRTAAQRDAGDRPAEPLIARHAPTTAPA